MNQNIIMILLLFEILIMCDIFCYKLYTTLQVRRLYKKWQLLLLLEHILQSDECDIQQDNNSPSTQSTI